MVSPSSPAPQGPRRQVAVIGTLMPHMAAGRHHVYRNVRDGVLPPAAGTLIRLFHADTVMLDS